MTNIDKIIKRRKAQARYKKTEKGKATEERYKKSKKGKIASKKWRDKNKHKTAAHRVIRDCLKLGTIKRLPCNICGKENSQAHHDDYSKPLDVIWLCQEHHKDLHKKRGDIGNPLPPNTAVTVR